MARGRLPCWYGSGGSSGRVGQRELRRDSDAVRIWAHLSHWREAELLCAGRWPGHLVMASDGLLSMEIDKRAHPGVMRSAASTLPLSLAPPPLSPLFSVHASAQFAPFSSRCILWADELMPLLCSSSSFAPGYALLALLPPLVPLTGTPPAAIPPPPTGPPPPQP